MNNRSLICLSVLSALSAGSYACDIDADSDTDIHDVRLIFNARGQFVPPGDNRDLNNDGQVTLADARLCMAVCTEAGCAEPAPNEPPVAEAGDEQTVIQGQEVTLDGSGSSDPESSPLTYQWQLTAFPGQSAPEVQGLNTVAPSFIAASPGLYSFSLVVNDGQTDSAADYVQIDAEAFGIPQDLQAVAGDTVVNVSWESVEAATSYEVIFGLEPGVTELNAVSKITVTNAFLSHQELENGQTYFYRVRALHDNGQSAYSDEVSATPEAGAPEMPLTFIAGDSFISPEIWRTDGTTEGTYEIFNTSNGNYRLINDFNSNSVPHQLNDKSVFMALNMDTGISDYWWSDNDSVSQLTDSAAAGFGLSYYDFYPLDDGMLALGSNYAIDGTAQIMLSSDGSLNLPPDSMIPVTPESGLFDDGWLFAGWSLSYGQMALMHRTLAGLETIIFDGEPVDADRTPYIYNNGAFLPRYEDGEWELYYLNFGVEQSIPLIRWRNSYFPENAQTLPETQTLEWNGLFYFNAYDDEKGYGLWRSDGTQAGTTVVKEFDDGDTEAEISELLPLGDKFVFQRHGVSSELWVTDGSTAGTVRIDGVTPVAWHFSAYRYTQPAVMNGLYFFAANDADGTELWVSDGTQAGTRKVKDINPAGDSAPFWFQPRDGYIIFAAKGSEEEGWELWRSDGTEEGTYLIKDICEDLYCSGMILMVSA